MSYVMDCSTKSIGEVVSSKILYNITTVYVTVLLCAGLDYPPTPNQNYYISIPPVHYQVQIIGEKNNPSN